MSEKGAKRREILDLCEEGQKEFLRDSISCCIDDIETEIALIIDLLEEDYVSSAKERLEELKDSLY